ncbi:MAG: type III toxin-antitoxin system ToxN/AbiQ family toxin [Oscillospiraceae bacterium]|nr:type III toxin-antitoxin system ToxN/AbiQ family toxin [Oscillospiraceae bacterium]
MESLKFYTVDNDYVEYLKKAETEARGFSRVPDMIYGKANKPKFLCGIVLSVKSKDYYVPVTSYKHQKPDNFLILASSGDVTSSLRFNYMFPVPKELVSMRVIPNEPDIKYRRLLVQELLYCESNQSKILFLAERTYKRVMLGKDKGLIANACDFKLLEEKCLEYCNAHNLTFNPAG